MLPYNYFKRNGISGEAPFTYNHGMVDLVGEIARFCSETAKARNIFEWMGGNISYNINDGYGEYHYKSAHQVFEKGQGICLDQAYLYATLARLSGLESKIVNIKKDNDGDRVCHACAYVVADGSGILVDTAYHWFGIGHRKYNIMSDAEVRKEYFSLDHLYDPSEGEENQVMPGFIYPPKKIIIPNFSRHQLSDDAAEPISIPINMCPSPSPVLVHTGDTGHCGISGRDNGMLYKGLFFAGLTVLIAYIKSQF